MLSNASAPSPPRTFAFAVAILFAAIALQWGMRPLVGPRVPFLWLFPALAIAAAWLGWRPAIIVLLGGFANSLVWLDGTGQHPPYDEGDLAAIAGFLVAGGVVLAMGAKLRVLSVEREAVRRDTMVLSRQVEVALGSSSVPFCLVRPVLAEDGSIGDFVWHYVNGAAARAIGRPEEEIRGRSVREVLPGTWNEPGLVPRFLRSFESGMPAEFEMQLTWTRAKSWFHVIASPCEGGMAVWFADMTERKRQEQLLRDADRKKDEFLATLAHELRNPLAPIRQATMIARSPTASPHQQRWSLEVIDRQVSHMAVLLDDLLDVSRITRGKLELRREDTPLRQVADAALEAARPAIEARQQHLEVLWPDEPLWASVDPMRMAQVLSNLLTNACKYTPPGGHITLAGRRERSDAVIEVRDDGIGIPKDALEHIFGMFTQVRDSRSPPSTGLGIGLALSRGLAELHDATLGASSEGPGHGSTFTLRLRLCEPPVLAARTVELAPTDSCRRRILVADDNRDAAESLAEMLRIEGHDVLLAFDGDEALALWREQRPEIALLDIGMPKATGNEVAAAIRASPEGRDVLLVAITGWGQQRDREAAREAGFDVHFTKPVDPDRLLRLIDEPSIARAA